MQDESLFPAASFRIFYTRLFGFSFLYFSLVAGSQAQCPVQLNPQRVVVKFGGDVSVDCVATIPHDGMGWEASVNIVSMSDNSLITWRVTNLTQWDMQPYCYLNSDNVSTGQCQEKLPVTVYKTPDTVSISVRNHSGPMMEGHQYELQCDVHDVAPVQSLTVKWYKGQTLMNQTTFTGTIKTPVSKSSHLLIRPDRADDGAQYWCEAELRLGAEGPQPPPTVSSEPLNITVHYKPEIDETSLPSTVPVFRNHQTVLVCKAKGNPKPTISWWSGTNDLAQSENLTISDSTPEDLYCNASNSVDSTIRHVKVVLKENYVPLILGIVIAIVVVILIISISINYIYNKTKRTGQYNVKKPNAPKGLLAQPAQTP